MITNKFCQKFSQRLIKSPIQLQSRSIFSYFSKNKKEEPIQTTNSIWDTSKIKNDLIQSSLNASLSISEKRIISKAQFLEKIEVYLQKNEKSRRGYLEFAQGALNNMETYDVYEDIDCYRAILELFPKDRLQVKSLLQVDLGYSKIQQDVVVELIRKMYKNKVMPDDSFGDTICKIFGYRSHAMMYYRKHMYWVPKTRYTDPYPTAEFLPTNYDTDPGYIARLAANRICPDKTTQFDPIYIDRNDSTSWCLVSSQSDNQRRLLAGLCSSWIRSKFQNEADLNEDFADRFKLYLDGPHFFFYLNMQLSYYTLWTETSESRLKLEFDRLINQENRSLSRETSFKYPLLGIDNELTNSRHYYMYLLDPKTKEKIPLLANDLGTEGPQKAFRRDIEPEFINRLSGVKEGVQKITPPIRRLTDNDAIDPNNVELRKRMIMENNLNEIECRNASRQIRPVFGLVYPEPEYTDKWSLMRRTHNLEKLPTNIYEKHEQVEGTILAVGVLGPSKNIYDRQEQIAQFESSIERTTFVKDPKNVNKHGRPINLTSIYESELSENRIQLAPETLLYKWFRHLEIKNPSMKYSSLILRAKKLEDARSS